MEAQPLTFKRRFLEWYHARNKDNVFLVALGAWIIVIYLICLVQRWTSGEDGSWAAFYLPITLLIAILCAVTYWLLMSFYTARWASENPELFILDSVHDCGIVPSTTTRGETMDIRVPIH